MMHIAGIEVDTNKLMTRNELQDFLVEEGGHDRALSKIRERYMAEFGNELSWHYPYSDGMHMGVHIVAVQEGFLSLPYDTVDREDYEIFETEHSSLFNAEAMAQFISDYELISNDLLGAMRDMLGHLQSQ